MKRALMISFASVLSWSMGVVAPAQAALVHHPRVAAARVSGNLGWASTNWSGYAVTGGTFNSVSAQWVVPTVTATRKATFSSSWVGIDGFNNGSLIQTGTEQDYFSHSAHYDAWWEILPAAETVIPSIAVSPGDHFSANIRNNGNGTWTISITDTTTGQGFTTTQSYSGPQSSAEWIQEAPTVGGRIAPLAHYGSTVFDPGTANGANPGFVPNDGGAMVQNGVTVSTPSNPDVDTDGFRAAYGATQPSPPVS